MRLQDRGIDDNNISVGRVIRSLGISDNNVGVGRGRRIDDASEVSEITTEAGRARKRARGIYDNNVGVSVER